jgi:type I restriction enzyme, S subunit
MIEPNGLPHGWAEATLTLITDINPPKGAATYPLSSPVHFVPMASVSEEFGGIDVSTSRPLSEVQKGYTAFRENDVLFAKITPCMENGKLAVVPRLEYGIGFGSTEFHVLRPTSAVTPRWIGHFLSQLEIRRVARRNMTGSAGQLRVPITWLADQILPLAPLQEQRRIVEKLEELFSDLDSGVACLQRAKVNLKRYRASVLKSAVEGRLTEEWRTKHPQKENGQMLLDRIIRERRKKWENDQLTKFKDRGKEPPRNWQSKYHNPPHEAGLYDLPSSWAWASALEACERVENGNTPPAHEMTGGSGDIPFIKVYNLTRHGRLVFTVNPTFISQQTHEQQLARSRVLPNDVLMNIVGPPLGKIAIVPATYPEWNMNQAIVLFRASSVVLPRYLAICLMSDEVLRWITRTAKATAGQFNISVGNSRLLPIPLPPLLEQQQIVSLVEERLSQIDSAAKAIDLELIRAYRLRQSILKQAFDGKLVPQNPSDEPASLLLERVMASRETAPTKKKAKKLRAI